MPTRKDTSTGRQKSRSQGERKSVAQWRKELARDLASVLSNPLTPSELYTFIADQHSEWESDKPWHSAEELERALLNHERKEAARKGGAQ